MNLKNCDRIAVIQNPKNQNLSQTNLNQRDPGHPPSSFSENLFRITILALVLLSIAAASAHACGQNFPNNLLSRGDDAVLAAPIADFESELYRLNLPASRFSFVEATNGYAEQSFDAEMADLATALKRAKVSPKESALIVAEHRVNKKKLNDYLEAQTVWESRDWMDGNNGVPNNRGPRPAAPNLSEVSGLPGEFADYQEGALAAGDPSEDDETARTAWERLLNRPAAERKFKSTWAAYRLGKSWEDDDDDKAVEYFQMTRDLAKRGFADSIGLATASLGREARVELHRDHCERAIELYLEQYAAGDESAAQSLRIAVAQAVNAGDELPALAASPNTRGLITAYLISNPSPANTPTGEQPAITPAQIWLKAVEAAGVKDVDSAERLALAAYQAGEFQMAQRWITRAKNTPVAQWIQAKLLLRAGKIPQAAALLAKVANQLPVVTSQELTNSTEFADSLHMSYDNYSWEEGAARERVLGELGVLHLSRREFSQALDALLRAGFWSDAAYVAERVLTTDELKSYVDREWPVLADDPQAEEKDNLGEGNLIPAQQRACIRYLLARRLTRELRGNEARDYFPGELQPGYDELMSALNAGWNESAPAEQRARSLFTAAVIARTNGMELLGTELQPDWQIHNGNSEYGVTWEERATNSVAAEVVAASSEEIQRAVRNNTDPNERFHYRYQAALLAWEAAKLMPNNSDETARMLCTAGSWLKQRDLETADFFYKMLVRRCRKTAIGDQADRMRWFPVLDEAGNPIPWKPRLETISPPAPGEIPPDDETSGDYPLPGKPYIIHRGDSLADIARAVTAVGTPLTVKEILAGNDGLNVTQIEVGQRILIPTPKVETENTVEIQNP